MKITGVHKILLLCVVLLSANSLLAQRRPGRPADVLRGVGDRIPGVGRQGGNSQGTPGGDSVIARDRYEDSITVTIYYLDSSRGHKPDSSINDFTRRFPIPATHAYLGNTGVATRSLIFQPEFKPGFDPGFHALDVYKWKLEKARFYNTTRPFTELGYTLGTRAEQIIEVMHTQNIRPSWNFAFNYRLINSPGIFMNQKTNHNNYLFTSWYQGKKKRYNNYFVILGNKLQAAENGGIANDIDYLNDIKYAKDRFIIPSKIGGSPSQGTDFFSTTMNTGNRYNEFNILMRQQYDLGKKDSIVSDSTVIPLFYPKLRFEHSFTYGKYNYTYQDVRPTEGGSDNFPDPVYYSTYYQLVPFGDSIYFRDNWKEISNDFSIYQFPDSKNLHQFFKVGIGLQLLNGNFRDSVEQGSVSLYNLVAHGEYRNRTKNQKWDMLAQGKLYLNGYNAGDYHAYIHLQRFISQ
ncbi:MAG TPA: putative porin, partial [Flavisolibacter sp.]